LAGTDPGRARRHVLLVAYYFPPLAGIASLRAMKLASYLPDYGWKVTVLAPSGAAAGRDDSLQFDEKDVVRARSLEISSLGKRVVGVSSRPSDGASPRGIHPLLRRLAHRFLYYPDAQVGWYPAAVRAGRKRLRQDRFDAILSSSVPITAHLVARRLHREDGIPWVAEFRDPWADVAGRRGGRRDRLERSLIRDAAAVVTVSPSWQRRFAEKGAARAFVVTNGFDSAEMPEPLRVDGFVVTYLGSLYPGLQDLSAVWEALRRLRARQPRLPLRVRFVGEVVPAVREEFVRCGLADILEVTGVVTHRAALAATMASSVLVAAGFHERHPLYRGVIPAKIFEYLGTGLPILYVGGGDTDAARLLSEQAGCRVVNAGDADGAFAALDAFRGLERVDRRLEPFTHRALAGRMAEILESVRR
jgi:hypothetical protein